MTCPTCNRATFSGCVSGFVLEDDRPVACPELYAALRMKAYAGSWPMPAKFRAAELGFFPPDSGRVFTAELSAAHRTMREFVSKLGEPDSAVNAYLSGTVGTGKSHLAAATARAAESKGIDSIFVSGCDLAARLKTTFDDGEETIPQIVEALTGVGLLVLDDLGEERLTDFIEESFYLILKRRLENEKPLIITTNLSGKRLLDRIGEGMYRLLDRMRDRGIRIKLEGESLRGRNAA